MKTLREILIMTGLMSSLGCTNSAIMNEIDTDRQKYIEIILEDTKPKIITEEGYKIGWCFSDSNIVSVGDNCSINKVTTCEDFLIRNSSKRYCNAPSHNN